jgi:hypothetical protein
VQDKQGTLENAFDNADTTISRSPDHQEDADIVGVNVSLHYWVLN